MTASQTTVVTATVMSTMCAKSSGRSLSSPPTVCSRTDTTNAAIIAETSLHALMRHQYQRSSSTAPVPAPVMISSFQAPPIDSMRKATAAENTVSRAVATRDAST